MKSSKFIKKIQILVLKANSLKSRKSVRRKQNGNLGEAELEDEELEEMEEDFADNETNPNNNSIQLLTGNHSYHSGKILQDN